MWSVLMYFAYLLDSETYQEVIVTRPCHLDVGGAKVRRWFCLRRCVEIVVSMYVGGVWSGPQLLEGLGRIGGEDDDD